MITNASYSFASLGMLIIAVSNPRLTSIEPFAELTKNIAANAATNAIDKETCAQREVQKIGLTGASKENVMAGTLSGIAQPEGRKRPIAKPRSRIRRSAPSLAVSHITQAQTGPVVAPEVFNSNFGSSTAIGLPVFNPIIIDQNSSAIHCHRKLLNLIPVLHYVVSLCS